MTPDKERMHMSRSIIFIRCARCMFLRSCVKIKALINTYLNTVSNRSRKGAARRTDPTQRHRPYKRLKQETIYKTIRTDRTDRTSSRSGSSKQAGKTSATKDHRHVNYIKNRIKTEQGNKSAITRR